MELIISNRNNILMGYYYSGINNIKDIYTKNPFYKTASVDDIQKQIKAIRDNQRIITKIDLNGENLELCISDYSKVILKNYRDFETDPRFDFLFTTKTNKKNIKDTILKGTAIAVSLVLIINGANYFISNKNKDVETINEPSNSYSSYVDEEQIIIEKTEEKQDNEVLENTDVITQDEKEKQEQSNEKQYDLGIATALESEAYINTREKYYPIIEKYSLMYGLDPALMCALFSQESGGVHHPYIDESGAEGLGQIQFNVWKDKTISAYNYNTGEEDSVTITFENLKDVEYNIQASCMIAQNYMTLAHDNPFVFLTNYNMGPGSTKSIITTYANKENKEVSEIYNNSDDIDLGWLNYRSGYAGDPEYIEHVLRYYNGSLDDLLSYSKDKAK